MPLLAIILDDCPQYMELSFSVRHYYIWQGLSNLESPDILQQGVCQTELHGQGSMLDAQHVRGYLQQVSGFPNSQAAPSAHEWLTGDHPVVLLNTFYTISNLVLQLSPC